MDCFTGWGKRTGHWISEWTERIGQDVGMDWSTGWTSLQDSGMD
jgi:hypothetical protein